MNKLATNLLAAKVDFAPLIAPVLDVLNALLWPCIAIVGAVGMIYCIFLGIKIAKSDEQNSREKRPDRRNRRFSNYLHSHGSLEDSNAHFGRVGEIADSIGNGRIWANGFPTFSSGGYTTYFTPCKNPSVIFWTSYGIYSVNSRESKR